MTEKGQRIAELLAEGATYQSIAATLGVNESTIRYWVLKLNLPTRRPGRPRGPRPICKHCRTNQVVGYGRVYCSPACASAGREAKRVRPLSKRSGLVPSGIRRVCTACQQITMGLKPCRWCGVDWKPE